MSFPLECEQPGCTAPAENYCPLCERALCQPHDPLYPIRKHDCLRGPADEAA